MENHNIKDKIINFVRNSPEDVNSKVAVFIAGMQAQKNLPNCQRETAESPLAAGRDGLSMVKTGSEKE